MALRHTLGGRTFLTVQETTVKQDLIFLELVKRAGIDEIMVDPAEDISVFSGRLLGALVKNQAVLELLGCLLIPAELVPRRGVLRKFNEPEKIWTPELGEETAKFLGSLHTGEDKAKIRSLVLTLVLDFFESGIISLWTTKTSSSEAIPIPDAEGESSRRADDTEPGPRSS
ncbi:hypothetical protein KAW64_13610 [bacterium]|nr:hypothetical protein [bacterium]